jgi:NAD(P)-dependent dehydrogenase (short-subunit alcohol dehydrogenase family)
MAALDGKVAIVTGASRGIGEYIARALAGAGAAVAVAARSTEVTDKRLPGTIYTVTEHIRARGGRALPVRLDVRDAASIADCVQQTVAEFGRVDIVVNNAAILVPGTIETVQPRHLDLIWQIDLRGPLLLIREALPHLRAAGAGHIINVSSGVAIFPGPGPYPEVQAGGSFYGMVKAGLERVSQGLAMELQDAGIAVNVLSVTRQVRTPGNVWAQNDPEHPNLNFEPAGYLGAVARWICEQPPAKFTGNIVFAEDLFAERGLEASDD